MLTKRTDILTGESVYLEMLARLQANLFLSFLLPSFCISLSDVSKILLESFSGKNSKSERFFHQIFNRIHVWRISSVVHILKSTQRSVKDYMKLFLVVYYEYIFKRIVSAVHTITFNQEMSLIIDLDNYEQKTSMLGIILTDLPKQIRQVVN